jgi:hypothetical protein
MNYATRLALYSNVYQVVYSNVRPMISGIQASCAGIILIITNGVPRSGMSAAWQHQPHAAKLANSFDECIWI